MGNYVESVGIPGLFGLTGSKPVYKDEGILLGDATALNFVGESVTATLNSGVVTVEVEGRGNTGFVGIIGITATNPSDNVGNIQYVPDTDDTLIASCVSSTNNITVQVMAVTAGDVFKPVVDVNGVQATLTRNVGTDVWVGTAAIALVGDTITATHNAGAIDTATVTIEAAPVITSLTFSGAYSQGVGQTEHAASQTLGLDIVTDTPIVALQVIDDASTATLAYTESFTATTSKNITVTTANRGNTPTAYPAKVRVQNANGTWSVITTSSNTIILNNSQPNIAFNSITYPDSQQAIKSGESATVNVTETNVDTVSYTSTELTVTDPTTVGNKTVTYASGTYNISTNNLTVTATKTSNATTATFNTVVWIANTAPTITVTTPAARLRSGVTPQNHTITISSNQRTLATPVLNASVGTFSGSWVTANNGLTWTRSLAIADSDTKGSANFTGLSITNLAGIEVTAITTGDVYTVGGFTQRTLAFAAYPNRESAIGTQVSDTSKLRVTNLSKGSSGSLNTSFVSNVGDAADTYTITQPSATYNAAGNTLYNRDLANAVSNTSGTMQFEIEEIV